MEVSPLGAAKAMQHFSLPRADLGLVSAETTTAAIVNHSDTPILSVLQISFVPWSPASSM